MTEAEYYANLGDRYHEMAKLSYTLAEKQRELAGTTWTQNKLLEIVKELRAERRDTLDMLEHYNDVYDNLLYAVEDQDTKDGTCPHWEKAAQFIEDIQRRKNALSEVTEETTEELT